MKKIIYTKDAPSAIGPYSQAILSNNTLYCSGQIAIDSKGILKNKSIEEETKQIIKKKSYFDCAQWLCKNTSLSKPSSSSLFFFYNKTR